VRIKYRPEIDGLRAIAVGAVIIYHAKLSIFGFKLFSGGFIGVDIFFVISGYLITTIILKELVTTGSFSFKYFYERRIRRILPALLFVMLVSLPFAWMYLLPSSFIDFSKSILYSLGFSSNFYFHYSGQIYGAESGLLKPFLHTWSLSVEEQFYILFPIVLLVTFKYFRKYLIYILILGFFISLGLADWSSRNYPSASFYFLHTRMWELLAGSILAYFEINNGHRSKNKILNLILPSVGLILIGHSILLFNDKMFHPSFYSLSPIIGVCLIIWFSNKDEIITKILSTKIFVGIGLISYSLYLWHYPVFAFVKILGLVTGGITGKLLLIPTLLFFSIISYHFVEKPFRNKKNNIKNILILIFISYFILTSFNLYVINDNGIKNRLPEFFQTNLKATNFNYYQKNNTQKVVLIGDSHADSLVFNLNEEIKKKNLSLINFSTQTYLTDFNYVRKKIKKVDKKFIDRNIKIDNYLKENSNLILVIHYRWTLRLLETYFDNEEGHKENYDLEFHSYLEPINIKTSSSKERQKYIKEGLISQINKIINQGHKLVLVYPVPEMGTDPYRYLFRKYIFNKTLFKQSIPIFSGGYEVYKNRHKLIFEILDSIENPNIYRVFPHSYFCDKQINDRCVANDENNFFYYDDNHLSLQGSKLIVDGIMKEIEKIELKSN
jgi:peptidoglycan/LPS O-acetylase OafA/YrhL